MKYFVRCSVGYVGMDLCDIIEADTEEQAQEEAYAMAVDNCSSYGFCQDPEHFGDNDTVGADWNEDENEYEQEGQVEYDLEEYDPEIHDKYLPYVP